MQQFVTAMPNSDILLKLPAGFFMFPEQPITGGQPGALAIAPEQMNRLRKSLSRFMMNFPIKDIVAFGTIWNAIMASVPMTSAFCGFAGQRVSSLRLSMQTMDVHAIHPAPSISPRIY